MKDKAFSYPADAVQIEREGVSDTIMLLLCCILCRNKVKELNRSYLLNLKNLNLPHVHAVVSHIYAAAVEQEHVLILFSSLDLSYSFLPYF